MARHEAPTDVRTEAFIPAEAPGSVQRSLGRQLLSADVIAGSLAGAAVALVSGLSWAELPLVVLPVSLAWPLLAWICGLHALDDVRAGAGDAARLLVTALVLSWPVYGLLRALDADHPAIGACAGVALMSLASGVMRAGPVTRRARHAASPPPTFSRAARVSKRTLDVVGACVGLLLLAPLLVPLVIAIRLESPGRAVFKQQRSGRGGRFFTLYKLRTMKVDALVLIREDGAIVRNPDGNRITRVGRVLRRFSFDEAPQLLNVVRGDMSLVGPRPLVLAEHASLADSRQPRRADLRPGMTGPWRLSGRSHIPFTAMIELDDQYVAGWSLARDIEILLATLPVVLSGRAY